jgi:hypothetical protein
MVSACTSAPWSVVSSCDFSVTVSPLNCVLLLVLASRS